MITISKYFLKYRSKLERLSSLEIISANFSMHPSEIFGFLEFFREEMKQKNTE